MNIRGFGGITKQKSLMSLFSSLNPDIILIQETMCDYYSPLHLFSKMRPSWEFCALDSLGILGGLLTSWNPHLTHCKVFHSYDGILVKAIFKGLDFVFSILNYYGPYSNKYFFWYKVLARAIFYYPNLILAGDLNFTLSNAEIWGNRARIDHMVHYFSHLLDSTNMVDLAPHTPGPTWRNDCVGHDGVSKRIDRFLDTLHVLPALNQYNS